jgi:hypothetical protein
MASPIGLRPLQQLIVSDWTNTLQLGRNNSTAAVIQDGRGVVAGCRGSSGADLPVSGRFWGFLYCG